MISSDGIKPRALDTHMTHRLLSEIGAHAHRLSHDSSG